MLTDCGLYIVGSSMSGFGTKTSDMDLCLMLSPYEVLGIQGPVVQN